jgi:hypothetical protein
MWAELIFSRDDFARLLEQALPLTIRLGRLGESTTEHSLSLSELSEVKLVPDVGLRVVCKARVHWPILGINVPVALNSLVLLFLPTIRKDPEGESLVFRLSIEHANFAGLPTVIDDRITAAVNSKLAEAEQELSWGFSKALAYRGPLPALLDPLESFGIGPAWGKVRVTDEAVVYAASFHFALARRDGAPRPEDGPSAP